MDFVAAAAVANREANVFRAVQPRRSAPVPLQTTPEARYWASFRRVEQRVALLPESGGGDGDSADDDGGENDDDDFPNMKSGKPNRQPIKLRAAVTHLEFSPQGASLAITTGSQVAIMPPRTFARRKVISRFKDVAYSASYKRDGKLVVAGGENSVVQVFDLGSRAILRTFRGHEGAVRTTKFDPSSNLHVWTGSDDRTVRLWDLSTEAHLSTFRSHTDYVRTQCSFPAAPHLWASGSYDHSVHLHDVRAKPTTKPQMALNHGQPVEALVAVPGSGTLMLSLGGSEIRLWDLLAGESSKPLRKMYNVHGKAVTCAGIGYDRNDKAVVLTGGLDAKVKVHNVDNWEVVQSMSADSQVLAVDLANDGTRLAIGTSAATLDVRIRPRNARLAEEESETEEDRLGFRDVLAPDQDDSEDVNIESIKFGMPRPVPKTGGLKPGSLAYLLRGKGEKPRADDVVAGGHVPRARKRSKHDKYLQSFQFGLALDAALDANVPEIITAVVDDLIRRDVLRTAVAGSPDRILRLVQFIQKHLSNPRHAELLVEASRTVLDICSIETNESQPKEVCLAVKELQRGVSQEVELDKQLISLNGLLDMALATAL